MQPSLSESIKQAHVKTREEHPDQPSSTSQLEEVISLEVNDSDGRQSPGRSPSPDGGAELSGRSPDPENGSVQCSYVETTAEEEPMSLSDLSSSFQQCFQSISQKKSRSKNNRVQSQEYEAHIQVKPFDYSAARKNINFRGVGERDRDGGLGSDVSGSGDRRRGSGTGRSSGEERVKGLRRHAFPPSGNRSTTYK